MNSYQSVFPEKKLFENIQGKNAVQSCTSNLDYVCHKSVEWQQNLKHFKFWLFCYC